MKKLAIFIVIFPLIVSAQDYNKEQVLKLSSQFLELKIGGQDDLQSVLSVDSIFFEGEAKLFLCQNGRNWVVIANEQQVEPVLCFGEGLLDLRKDHPLMILLTDAMIGLQAVRNEQMQKSVEKPELSYSISAVFSVTPLLNEREPNRWMQSMNNSCSGTVDAPVYDHSRIYNMFCPTFFSVDDGRTVVGCTAVAMGQILWFHQKPDQAYIKPTISIAGVTSGTAELHTYDWSLIRGGIYNYTTYDEVKAIAGLLRDCGYAGHAIYSGGGTSMTLTNAISALRNTFNMEAHMKQYSSGATIFNNLIKSELSARRPVMIQATHATNGGTHTFVIDAYDSVSDSYHINLGWGSSTSTDTWFSNSGYNAYDRYTVARRMLYGIEPATSPTVLSVVDGNANLNVVEIMSIQSGFSIQSESPVQWYIYDIMTGSIIVTGEGLLVDTQALQSGRTYYLIANNGSQTKQVKFTK